MRPGPTDRFAERLGRFVTRNRTAVLALAAVAALGCAAAIAHFGLVLDNSPEVFERQGERSAAVLAELHERFGRDDAFVIAVQGDVVDPGFLKRVEALDGAIAGAPLPAGRPAPTVVSVATATFPVQFGTSAAIFPLIDQELPPDFMRKELLDNPFVNGRLVGRQGQWTALLVRTAPLSQADSARAYDQLQRTLTAHTADDFAPLLGGLPALDVRLNALTVVDMGQAFALAGAAMTLLLIVLFRHPYGVVGPVLVVNGAVLATVALTAVTGTTVNYLNSIVPTFLVAVGVGDGVHVQAAYRQLRADGAANDDAIVGALSATARAILFTSLTTIAGLLSFRTASIRPIVELGTLAAFGVGVALLLSVTVLPAFLTLNHHSTLGAIAGSAGRPSRVDRLVAACWRLGVDRPRAVLAVGVVTTVAACALACTVQVRHDPLAWFPDHLPTRRVQRLLDDRFSGAAQIDLLVDVEGSTLADPPILAALADLERRAQDYRDPGGAKLIGVPISPTNTLRDKPTSPTLLTDPKEISFGLNLLHDRFPDLAGSVLAKDLKSAHVIVPLRWLPATQYAPVTAHLRRAISESTAALDATPAASDGSAPRLRVRPTGLVYSLLSTMGVLVPDLIRSFGLAFVVITLMMVALLRDLRLGLVAMVPNLLPIVMGAAFMGAAGIPLDASTVLLFSIALGLCVDDTMHLLHRFQTALAASADCGVADAVEQTQRHTGRAIVYTSALLIAATAPTVLSTLHSLVWFGAVLAWIIASALLADLILTPVVLRYAASPQRSAAG